jgi:hypothetical protein
MMQQPQLEEKLDSFSREERRAALLELSEALRQGAVQTSAPSRAVNLHAHTFFSYNALGYSPSRLAWEARKAGLAMLQTVDFDVLDAMEEIYEAGDLLGLRTSAGLETRVYVEEYAEDEISSPGEPGIAYFMGVGFCRLPQEEASRAILAGMAERAQARNRVMAGKVNHFLGQVSIAYDADVIPLTPAGKPTERHMLEAYETASSASFGSDGEAAAEFWAGKLDIASDYASHILSQSATFRDTLRSKLMKRGGPGYTQPDRTTFPALDDAIAMIRSAGAIPTITWLDGTTSGEEDANRLVDVFVAKGCEALNIIPDRNWNLTHPAEKERKTANLYEIVEICREWSIPVLVGTEINKAGQKFVDTFDAPELAPVAEDFYRGADFLYGHTLMARALGHGRISPWAEGHFRNRAEATEYYASLGQRAPEPAKALERLRTLADDHSPGDALSLMS